MNIFKGAYVVIATTCATSLHPSVAQSQTEPEAREQGRPLEEIVVTARRREESLQNVPISIVAHSGEYLELARVESFTELDRVVPGFMFKEYESGGQSTIGIRGLSTFSQSGAQQSVGVLVDGVTMSFIGQTVTDFDDVERIEVLRGPQGTLFGRNTTGGVVQIVTNDPTDEFGFKASMTYGSYDEVKWNGTINLPVTENISARTSLFTLNREGHIENINNGQMLGADEQVGVRTKVLYAPDENTRFLLGLHYVERAQQGNSSGGGRPVVAFGPATSDLDRQVNAGIVGPENDKVNGVGFHPYDDQIAGVNLTWEQAIGEFELTSITAYEYWTWDFGEDKKFRTFNAPVEPLFWENFYFGTRLNAWSQELRLASPIGRRFEYVVGAFVNEADSDGPGKILGNLNSLIGLGPDDPPIFIFSDAPLEIRNFNYALFGEADFHLTDTLTVTAGTRWTHDETDQTTDAQPPPGFDPDSGLGFGPNGELYIPILGSALPGVDTEKVSENLWSWRAGLRWQPVEDLMVYGMAARGTKGPAISAVSAPLVPVASEFATNYELGVKTGFWDNRILTSLTLFHTDVEDFQAESQVNVELPGGTTATQFNLTSAGEVRSRGVEFELSAVPTDQLSFNFAVAYIDAIYKTFLEATCYESQTLAEGCVTDPDSGLPLQDLSGRHLPFTPEWSGTLAANYDFTLPFSELNHFMRLDYTYQSEIHWNLGLAPLNESDAVGIWGLSLGVSSPDERYQVVGYIKNLTDEFVVNGLNGGNEAVTADLQPDYRRTWGIQFRYSH